jgi:hypothetical protein
VIPAGEFKGKSKQLYDCLYSMTRGAIQPARSVRISRPRLMKKAGIGARVTFEANIAHLTAVGLLQVRQIAGEHEGNEYIVFLPEERSMPSQSSQTRHAQDQDRPVSLESSQTRHTLSVDSAITSADPKTSFKTSEKNLDDEASATYRAFTNELARALAGREATRSDYSSMRELFDVILTEARIAGNRASVVSSPAAFTAEPLRRRLFKKGKAEMEAESREAPAPKAKVNAQDCPDCHGAGFFYPDGFEKGVAKCKHANLKKNAVLS